MSVSAVTASGPTELYSSSPTFAVPNQGRSSRAMRNATTRSSTSITIASLSRISAGASVIDPSDDVGHGSDTVPLTPLLHFSQDPQRCTRICERSRADLHRACTGQEQLDGVGPARHAADAHDRRVGQRGV